MSTEGGYGFGIVGIGMIAAFHAKALKATKGGHASCLFSRSGGEKAEKLAAEYGLKLYVKDFDAFLKHPGLDVVSIANPSGAHLEPALAAASAGKHVICEKPLEITLERCDEIIKACKKSKVLLGGIFPMRTGGAVQAIRTAIEQGRFGRITVCNALIPWYRTQQYYDGGGWRGTWKLDGGGALMNQSIHTIDLLQWLVGPVKEIVSFAGCQIHERIEVEDSAVAALKFKNGALGTIVGSTAMFPGAAVELQISGEKGTAKIIGDVLTMWSFDKERKADEKIKQQFGPQPGSTKGGASDPGGIDFRPHQLQFENFVKALNKKGEVMVDGKEARKAVEIILGVYQSALTGAVARLPLKETPARKKFPKI